MFAAQHPHDIERMEALNEQMVGKAGLSESDWGSGTPTCTIVPSIDVGLTGSVLAKRSILRCGQKIPIARICSEGIFGTIRAIGIKHKREGNNRLKHRKSQQPLIGMHGSYRLTQLFQNKTRKKPAHEFQLA